MKSIVSLILLALIVGCTAKKTDKELFNDAQKNLKEEKIPEAVQAFDEIVKEYPESNFAPEALSQLATIYQNKQVKSLSESENLKKAVESFKKIHDNYPQSEYAPTGLFMAGFINANELQNYDEATKLYEQFLNEYPDHELVPSAQAELNFMGMSPEDIIEKNVAKEE